MEGSREGIRADQAEGKLDTMGGLICGNGRGASYGGTVGSMSFFRHKQQAGRHKVNANRCASYYIISQEALLAKKGMIPLAGRPSRNPSG